MNKMKRIVTMAMFASVFSGATLGANSQDRMSTMLNIVSENAGEDIALQSIASNTIGEENAELAVTKSENEGFNRWLLAIPVVGAMIATGGLVAVPLLSGAVSAEVAMGAALALAVI